MAERGKWGEKLMEAHSHYRDMRYGEAFVHYALLSELGYEVAQSNAAFMLDRGKATIPMISLFRRGYGLLRLLDSILSK